MDTLDEATDLLARYEALRRDTLDPLTPKKGSLLDLALMLSGGMIALIRNGSQPESTEVRERKELVEGLTGIPRIIGRMARSKAEMGTA